MNLRTLLHRFIPANIQGEHRRTGRRGERLAAKHLKQKRYRILARNPRTAHGEIDLFALAPDGRTVVMVEVKTNATQSPHRPEVRVHPAKQRKIVALAADLARRHNLTDRPIRFDIVAVELATDPPTIRHHQAAFDSHV